MKKLAIISLAAFMVVAFTMPAAAFESIFGGYWRTRFYTNQDFNGADDLEGTRIVGTVDEDGNVTITGEEDREGPDADRSLVDTRTRLYYTAKFSDNFKFVNKFEMDATWGRGPYGDIGADGVSVEVKNTYADFDMGALNAKIGVQGFILARGFIADDDFAGAHLTYGNDLMSLPVFWFKAYEGGDDNNTADVDIFGIAPTFNMGESLTLKPYALYWMSDNLEDYQASGSLQQLPLFASGLADFDDADIYYVGADLDWKLDVVSLFLTGIYQWGTIDFQSGNDTDISSYLLNGGASMNLGPAELHAQAFYATGDDDPFDEDIDSFFVLEGASHYWAEIMGYGVFDFYSSAGAPADQISNVWAANIGATFKPMDKLSITADVWYAELVEDDLLGENELGTEVDLKVTYKLMENLTMDVVGAYLFAGDATRVIALDVDADEVVVFASENDDNPYEVGMRLSLSF
jgi:hypothetical protein